MADVISFARGAPSADLLPVEAVREAANRALDNDSSVALSYGTGIGHAGLCEWIANQHDASPSGVMVTNGSLEAGWMLFDHLLEPGDEVVVEQPSYDRTLLMLERLGVDRIGVPVEADGIDVDGIEQALADGHRPKLVHIIPNFHNPAGCTLSEGKRRRLVELSAEHGFWIFEDDPYREVRFSDAVAQPTMLSLAKGTDAKVVHASSFTKTVCPGVRVGYLVGPDAEVGAIAKRAAQTYISPNMLSEAIIYDLCCSGGVERNIALVNKALAERRDAVVEELETQIPEAEFVVPGGGYFLWLDLAEGSDTTALVGLAKEEGVAFVAGPDFMLEGGERSLRLSFASVPAGDVPEGISRIARALAKQRA